MEDDADDGLPSEATSTELESLSSNVPEVVRALLSVRKHLHTMDKILTFAQYSAHDGTGTTVSEGIQKYFGGKTDHHVLRPLYSMTVFSPLTLLANKQLVTRKQTSIPLCTLYTVSHSMVLLSARIGLTKFACQGFASALG